MNEKSVEARLQALSNHPLKITWHENKRMYLRIKIDSRPVHFHLHRLFLQAPSPVLEALIRYGVHGKRKEGAVLRQMAELYFSTHKIPSEGLDSKGEVYDLKQIFEQHERNYFFQKIESQIGWFEAPSYRKFRSMTFGLYDRLCGQIRLNRLLDSNAVPPYFVEFIVYHEMLHAVCPPIVSPHGRTMVHTAQFRKREKEFREFALAKEWEKQSLHFFKKRHRHGRA